MASADGTQQEPVSKRARGGGQEIPQDASDPHIESENFSPSYTESSNDPVIVNSEEVHTIAPESPLLPLTPSPGTPTSLVLDSIELEVHRS